LQRDTALNFSVTNVYPGRLIPAGKQLDMIIAVGDLSNAERLSEIFGSDNVKIEIEYESVYEESWILNGIGKAPAKK
jgi:hypothetical protein